MTADIVELATQYGRYGYRRITALLHTAGWAVNVKHVERIWRREGLKVPQRQPKRRRLWLNDGSCVRLRPEYPNHVWSYDFVEDRTHNGRKFRMLSVIDEFTRECLAIRIGRRLRSSDVIDVLSDLFILRGVPGHVRSDNGPEFAARAVRDWIAAVGARTAFIEPGSPWENGYCESFNAKLRDELLNGEIFYIWAGYVGAPLDHTDRGTRENVLGGLNVAGTLTEIAAKIDGLQNETPVRIFLVNVSEVLKEVRGRAKEAGIDLDFDLPAGAEE